MILLFLIVAAIKLFISISTDTAPVYQILQPGVVHGDEVPKKLTSPWFALVGSKDGSFSLKKVELKIKWAQDIVLDDEGGPWTGRRIVSYPKVPESAFLIGGDTSLTEGPVTGKEYEHKQLDSNEVIHFRMLSQSYSLQSRNIPKAEMKGKDLDGTPWKEIQKLFLVTGKTKQDLHVYNYIHSEGACLLWAGDLDRDGKLDLITDNTDHYNVVILTLYLSSHAKKGELVHKVCEWRTVGC